MARWWCLVGLVGCTATISGETKTSSDSGDEDDEDDPTLTSPPTTTPGTEFDSVGHTGVLPLHTGEPDPVDDSVQQLCVDTINAYRATLGLPPYSRWTSGEACADGEAASDAASGTPHGAFGSCGEWAQNECPGWYGPLESITTDCLAMMWAEGPGADFSRHGHYINMSSTRYSEVACGYYEAGGGSVWAVQNFR